MIEAQKDVLVERYLPPPSTLADKDANRQWIVEHGRVIEGLVECFTSRHS